MSVGHEENQAQLKAESMTANAKKSIMILKLFLYIVFTSFHENITWNLQNLLVGLVLSDVEPHW